MVNLPKLPARIARLPKSDRGYPVPWFVSWLDEAGKRVPTGQGKPDFRYVGEGKILEAYSKSLCWICGVPLGVHQVYVIGPMCVVNRVTSEPACHRQCAEFAATACPFLVNPREKRNEKGMHPESKTAPGIMIKRNPGATALYETKSSRPFEANGGVLFRLGLPTRVDWYAEGRKATRAEVEASIHSGYPLLEKEAHKDGPRAVQELAILRTKAMALLPTE